MSEVLAYRLVRPIQAGGGTVYRVPGEEEIDWRLDLQNHSPNGLNWGYGGSGPSQTALAILADFLDDETALQLYPQFTRDVISNIDKDDFTLSIELIVEWALSQEPPL